MRISKTRAVCGVAATALLLGCVATQPQLRQFVPALLKATVMTVQITAGAASVAVPMALIAALMKMYGPLPLRWLAIGYIEVFRGTSALVQLFWLFFVLPHFGVELQPVPASIIALGLNIGAYGAEVVRGALQAVARGQWEATIALNMSFATAMRRVIIPQAVVAMIPPWGNLFIELLKSTSLVSMITVADLTFRAQQLNQFTFKTVPIFTLVLLIYLIIAVLITFGFRTLEGRASQGIRRKS
ncbi:ectoine/hydroxyectoine ABC transporter permease subunit EhuC [Paraburkholderia diazotrophica]|uniref:Amino acid ABC transporter membrane protein 1, PAAT family n=1 Tax=Paraburkholderia diazotrophica TaxID=667676 RepID=A0A1H7DUQ1_9BURK|nr:ectoine/hydroxyectoine ABC transporter permease subunit EhuC [Paraburkholderia diazotrophica]SEK05473.1 amino acid ABC transporter membrane protein 1, PAAT family [Paraburkholderia diazotrophica]